MGNKSTQLNFILMLLVGVSFLAYLIFQPFFYALIFAAVFAVVFQPVHQRILKLFPKKEVIPATLSSLVIIIAIFTPIAFLTFQVSQEARQIYLAINEGGEQSDFINIVNNTIWKIEKQFPSVVDKPSIDIRQYFKQGLSFLFRNMGSVFSNIAQMVFMFFMFLVSLYYLLKDGPKLKKKIIMISPLGDGDDEMIFHKLEKAVNAVLKGRLLVASIQGVLATVAFVALGVPSAVLWGSVTIVAAIVPGIGTSLVILPVVFYLYLKGSMLSALILFLWGITVVGLVDNVLGPKVVGDDMHMHPLVVLLSVLGGITIFGPAGFLLGPLVMSMLFALLDVYFSLLAEKVNSQS